MDTTTRLNNELRQCSVDDDLSQLGCSFGLIDNDIFKWKVTMVGPQDTPYSGGIFTIRIEFPNDYPKHGPEFIFLNKMYHLNVNFSSNTKYKKGHVCLNTINQWNSYGNVDGQPNYGVKQALFDIFCLFYNQGTDGPFDDNMAKLYKNEPEKFKEIAKKWTIEYAKPC